MVDVQAQTIQIYRGEDAKLIFTPDSAGETISTWAWAFTVKGGGTQYVFLTSAGGGITISGENVYVIITRTISKALSERDYDFDLWRTDTGSYQRKAGGTFTILTEQYPYTL